MLQLVVPGLEKYDEVNNEFIYVSEQTLTLEHSLLSISKWESTYCKPFLTDKGLTYEETINYIRCMTLDENVDPEVYTRITNTQIEIVKQYMNAPMTATVVTDSKSKKGNNKIITNELVYYWMITSNIPMECETWHFNRLMMLIRVYNAESQPARKMSMRERMTQNRALNASRRKQLNSKG